MARNKSNKAQKPAKKQGAAGNGGTSSDYQPYMCNAVRDYLLLHGKASNKAIGDHLGFDESTISRWRSKYEAFEDAVKEGKDGADSNVAASGYKLATGYDYEEEAVIKLSRSTKEGREEYTEKVKLQKHKPPNITAIQFWLANRHQEEWTRTDRIKMKVEQDDTLIESDEPSPYLAMLERFNIQVEAPKIPDCPVYIAGESRSHASRHTTEERPERECEADRGDQGSSSGDREAEERQPTKS